jgi:hypothetical protein
MHEPTRTVETVGPDTEDSLFHIPRGSSHWVEVAEGSRLYNVWLDFSESREG